MQRVRDKPRREAAIASAHVTDFSLSPFVPVKQAHGQGECAGDHESKHNRDRGHTGNMDKNERYWYPESIEKAPDMRRGGLGVEVEPIEQGSVR